MTWKEKLSSRKFILAAATFVSAIALTFFGTEIDPLAITGAAGILIAYMGGQSWVDKSVVQGNAEVMKNEALLQAKAYIAYLENELRKAGLDDNVVPIVPEDPA